MASSLEQDSLASESQANQSIFKEFRKQTHPKQSKYLINQGNSQVFPLNKSSSNSIIDVKGKFKQNSKLKIGNKLVKNLFHGYKQNQNGRLTMNQTLSPQQFDISTRLSQKNEKIPKGNFNNDQIQKDIEKIQSFSDIKSSVLRSRNDLIQYYTEGSPVKKRDYQEIMKERLFNKKVAELILQGDLSYHGSSSKKIKKQPQNENERQSAAQLEDISDFFVEVKEVRNTAQDEAENIVIHEQDKNVDKIGVFSTSQEDRQQISQDQVKMEVSDSRNIQPRSLPLGKQRKSKFISQRVASSDQNQVEKPELKKSLIKKESDMLIISLRKVEAERIHGEEIKEAESMNSSHIEVNPSIFTNQLQKSNSVVNKKRRSSLAQHPELNESSIHLLQKESVQNTSQNSPLQNFAINDSRDHKKSLEQITDMRHITAPFPSLMPLSQQPISSSSGDSGLRTSSHREETIRGKDSLNSHSGDILEQIQTQNNSLNPLDQSRTSLVTLGNIGQSRNVMQQATSSSGGINQSFNELRSQPRNPSQKSQGKQDHHDFTSILKQYGKMKERNAIKTKMLSKKRYEADIPKGIKQQLHDYSIQEEKQKHDQIKRGLIKKQATWVNTHQSFLIRKKTTLMSRGTFIEGEGSKNAPIKLTHFKPFIFKDPHIFQGKPLSDRSYTISHSANQLLSNKELMIDNFRFKLEDLIEAAPTRKDSDDALLLKLRSSNPQLFNVKRNSPDKEKGREGINAGKFSVPFQRKVSEPAQGLVKGTTNGANGPARRRFSKLETLTPSKEARQRLYNQQNNLENIRQFDETGNLGGETKAEGTSQEIGSPDKFKTQSNLLRLIGRSKTQSKIQLSFGQHSIKQDLDKLQKDEESIRISRILLKNEMKHNQESLRQDRNYNLRFSEVMNDIFKNSRRTDNTFDSLTESSHETSYLQEESEVLSNCGSPRIVSHLDLDKYEEQFHNKITIQNSNKASFFNQSFQNPKTKRPQKQGQSSSNLISSGLMLSVASSFMTQSKAQIRLNMFDEKYREALSELTEESDEADFIYEVKDRRFFVFVKENLAYPEISNSLVQFSTNQQIEVKVLRQLSQGRRGASNKIKAEQAQAAMAISNTNSKTLGEGLVRHRSNPNQLTVFTNSLNSTLATQAQPLNNHSTSASIFGKAQAQTQTNINTIINTTSLTLHTNTDSKKNQKPRSLSILDRALQDLNDGFRLLFPLTEEGEHHFQLIDVMRDEKFTHLFKSTEPQLYEENEERIEYLSKRFMIFLQKNIFNQDVEFYHSLFKSSKTLKTPSKNVISYRHNKKTSIEFGKYFQQENWQFFRRNILQEIIRSIFLTEYVSSDKLLKKDTATLKVMYDRLSKILKASVQSLIYQKGPDHVRNLSISFLRRNSSPTRTNIASGISPATQRARLKSHIFLSDHLNFISFNQDTNNNYETEDGITIFDQKKYKNGEVSSFKLNEVFGYSAKTLSFNLYEVFEPKADARNIIYKGLKKKKLLLGMSSKQNQPYDLRVTNVDDVRAESARAGGHHHTNSRDGDMNGLEVVHKNLLPRGSAISGHSNNTINTNFYSNFTNSNSNTNSNKTNPNSGNKLLIPSNIQKTRRQSTLGVNQTSFKSIGISNNIASKKEQATTLPNTAKDNDSINSRRRSSFGTKMKTMYYPHSGSLPSGVEQIRQMYSSNPRHAHIEKLNTITTMNRDISVGLLGGDNQPSLFRNGSPSSNRQNPSPLSGKIPPTNPSKRRASKVFGFNASTKNSGRSNGGTGSDRDNSPQSNGSNKSPKKQSNMKQEQQHETLRIKKN